MKPSSAARPVGVSTIPSSPEDAATPEPWRPPRSLSVLLLWTAVTTVVLWLPTVRGMMDGSLYGWGLFGFGGRGTGGDYWFVATGSALALLTFWLGWRGGRFPVHLLLVGWHGFLATGAVLLALRNPDALRFQGDTLGVDLTLAWGAPLLFGAFALLAVGWALADARSRKGTDRPRGVAPWSRRNAVLLGAAIGLLPMQFLLLRFGPQHGTADQIGVVLTLLQWGMLAVAFRPRAGASPGTASPPHAATSIHRRHPAPSGSSVLPRTQTSPPRSSTWA